MQRVSILNSGTIGATLAGTPGFGPWQPVSDVRHRLSNLLETRARGLIIEAHQIEQEKLTIPILQGEDVLHRQRLGFVTPDPQDKTVRVEIWYELQDLTAGTTSTGEVVFRCR